VYVVTDSSFDRDPHTIAVLTQIAERAMLCRRCQARAREESATEALIVVVGRPGGAILLACLCRAAADLAGRRGERALMMVRLMARHSSDQAFAIVATLCCMGDAASVAIMVARAGDASFI
jgi:hypothetical protein